MNKADWEILRTNLKGAFPLIRMGKAQVGEWSALMTTVPYPAARKALNDYLATTSTTVPPTPHQLAQMARREQARTSRREDPDADVKIHSSKKNAGLGLVRWEDGRTPTTTWERVETLHPVGHYTINGFTFTSYIRRIDHTMNVLGARHVNACLAAIGVTPRSWSGVVEDKAVAAKCVTLLASLYAEACEGAAIEGEQINLIEQSA